MPCTERLQGIDELYGERLSVSVQNRGREAFVCFPLTRLTQTRSKKSLEKVCGLTEKSLEKVDSLTEKSLEKVVGWVEKSLEKVAGSP